MRDIPLFTTENGVASLLFKKIPYTKEAFVHIRDSLACKELVKECVDICRMAGAERVYATGHNGLHSYPLHCSVLGYHVAYELLSKTEAVALPVSVEQKTWWRQIYNQKMAPVPTAAPLSDLDTEKLICEGKAFCIYLACSVIGIGVAYDGQIQAVASVSPGGGRDAVLALADSLHCANISLSVASTNEKAITLYKSLGFEEMSTEAVWYKIL